MRGKIIEFEGLDCSFKETNAERLKEYLQSKGYTITKVSFPRYDNGSSIFIKKMLEGTYENVDPKIAISFFALDRYDYIYSNNIKERLENGEWFIFDRYVGSNALYQTIYCGGEESRDRARSKIYKYEYDIMKLPKPDIVLAMYSDIYCIFKLLKNKKTDIYEDNKNFLYNLFRYYTEIIEKEKWKRIDVSYYGMEKDKDIIFDDILNTLKENNIIV